MGLVGGVSVLLLQLAYEAIFLAPDFLQLVVGKLAPLFPCLTLEFFPLALDDVPVHLRLPLASHSERLDRAAAAICPPWIATKPNAVTGRGTPSSPLRPGYHEVSWLGSHPRPGWSLRSPRPCASFSLRGQGYSQPDPRV